jgi:hypothetical protein
MRLVYTVTLSLSKGGLETLPTNVVVRGAEAWYFASTMNGLARLIHMAVCTVA